MIKCNKNWLVVSASFIFINLMFSMHALPQEINRAAEIGDIKKIKEFLKNNPESVNAKNKYNLTPLHYAAPYGNKNVAELLILNGADIHSLTGAGDTPLHHAAFGGDRESTELLLARGAEINARNKEGRTPLCLAVTRGNKEVRLHPELPIFARK